MHTHLMSKHLMCLHLMFVHAKLVAVSDVAEHGLVQEWHELLARYSAVFTTLECRLQERHGIGANEFEALERLATCDFKCRSADLTGALHLRQSATSRPRAPPRTHPPEPARHAAPGPPPREGGPGRARAVRGGPARHLRHPHRRRPGEV